MRNCLCIVIALISSVSRGQDVAPGRPASEYLAEADRLAGLRAWTRAERFFAHAERAFEEAGDSRNALYAKLGRIRGELPRRSVADVSQQLADILELPLAMTDDRIRLRCLIIKGEVDVDYDADLAEQDWREALTIAKRLNDPLWVNRANAELGITVALQGRTSDGLFMIASALKNAEATKDLSSVVRWSSVIGKGLFQFGRPEEALKLFDRAIAAGSSVDELRFSLMAYLGKITALTKLKRFEEARELLATTLAVARERESFGYQAELLLQDALLTEAGGTREDAVQRLLEAADFARRAGANRVLAEIYLELGRLQLALGRKKDAAGTFRAGIQSTRAMRERLLSPRLLAQFAEIEMANGQLPAARALLEEAAEIAEGLLAGVWSPWVKSRLVAVMDSVFLARLRLEVKAGADAERIFPIVEQARGRAITDLIMGRGQGARTKSLGVKEGEQRISALQAQLWSVKGPASRQRILDQIFRAELEMFAASLQADRERHSNAIRRTIGLTDLRRSLAAEEVLLEYVLDEPTSTLLAITRERAHVIKLPSKAVIKQSVDAAWRAIQAGQEPKTGADLSELLKVPGLQSKSRVIIIPDGELSRLPFEVVTLPSGSRLIESHAVSYAPSATALYLIRRQTPPPTNNAVLAVAASPDVQRSQGPAEFGKISREVYDLDGSNLPGLPAAKAEAFAAVEAFPNPANELLADADATESAVKRLPLRDFSIAHFAAHGLLSSGFPERSALALRPSTQDDGFLQGREVLNIPFRASLVTLSACNTGAGKLFGQDGVSSLVRPFLAAGARAVAANLWTADDTFSLALMKEFYRELALGKIKAVALQQAKLTMIRRYGKVATPKLWSGLILFGEGAEPILRRR